jgi:glyoxylase-like metal-dependent hydrolase (beta-lactamase superfamily II)
MAKVKVLVKGEHYKNEDGSLRLYSSSTLIKSDKNIVVDTGSFLEKDTLIKNLKEENLSPEDIEIVVLTHMHLDHVVNIGLFKNAKVYCKFKGQSDYPGQFHDVKTGTAQRTEISDGVKLTEEVEFILTPGHTPDMISVVIDTADGKVVVTGDAFPDSSFLDKEKQPNPMLNDVEEFNKSRNKILKIADYIVPGHGDIFKVE